MVTLVAVDWISATTAHLLLSDLSAHSRNLRRDGRASLLVRSSAAASDDPMAMPRASMVGQIRVLNRDQEGGARPSFVSKHPAAAMYADFGDFSVYRFDVSFAHLIAGFGRIESLTAEQLA